ncbi:unnamed protein product [Cylindrotheca closterium]|uniref:Uncharacterized protein n=1 Tax=Cylindrotheca closterium TaxID=2856 RepID=A0AAD2CHL9_9STRA|nr:unnamed protein product [Cylindrotheca closterium]
MKGIEETLAKLLVVVLLSVSVAPAAGRHHHRGTKKRRMQKMLKMKKDTSVTTSRKGTKLTASSVKGAMGGTIVVGSKGVGGQGGSKVGFNAPFPAPVVLLPLIPTLAPSMEEPSRQPVTRIPTRTPRAGGGGGGAVAAPTVCLSTPCQTTAPPAVPCGVGGVAFFSSIATRTLTAAGQTLSFDFTGLPAPIAGTTVFITASYTGDIVNANQCMEIQGEDGPTSSGFCKITSTTTTTTSIGYTTATAAEFNAWNADGTVTIQQDASSFVTAVGTDVASVQMQYCTLLTCGTPGVAAICPNQPATPVDCTAFPGTASVATTAQTTKLTSTGQPLALSFAGLADSLSPVNILASFDGDIDSGARRNECMDILSEGGVFSGSCYFDDRTYGAGGIAQVVTQATAAEFNAWNVDGTVTLTMDADSDVNRGGAGGSEDATFQLQYCAVPPCGVAGVSNTCPNQPATVVDCASFPGTTSVTSPILSTTLTSTGQALSFSFTGLPNSASPVNIIASFDGDTDNGAGVNECVDIVGEGGGVFSGSCYFDDNTSGAGGGIPQVVTQATASEFNSWNVDGTVTLTLDADSGVVPGGAAGSDDGTVQLQYCALPPCQVTGVLAICPNQPAPPVDCTAFVGSVSVTRIQSTILTTRGQALSLSFAGLPDSVSPVNVIASFDGDIDGGARIDECMDIVSESGLFSGSCYFDDRTYGAGGIAQVVTQATAAEFNAWNVDGTVTIIMDADDRVDSGGGSGEATVELQYCAIPPPPTCGTDFINSACPNQPATPVDCTAFPGTISTTSPILTTTLTSTGQALSFAFAGLPDSQSPVNVIASFDGGTDQNVGFDECIDIVGEDGVFFSGSCYFDDNTSGAGGGIPQVVTQATAAEFNSWNADGIVTLILDADSGVVPGGAAGSDDGTVQLQYCFTPPPGTCGTSFINSACPNQPATSVDCTAFAGTTSVTSPIITTTLTSTGQPLSFAFTGLANSVSPVNILASFDGDIDSGARIDECMDIISESGLFSGSCYFDDRTYGAGGIAQVVTQATAAEFNAWNVDGTVTLTLDADIGVNRGGAGGSEDATIQLQYCA